MPEPTPETLAVWLRDVVATIPDAETLKAFHAAVVFGAKCNNSELLDVVALGHGAGAKHKIEWFADRARSKDAPIPPVGNEELVARLAAASTVRVATSGGDAAIVAGLATQSAAFLGLKPDLPELLVFADDTIAKASDAARARVLRYQPTAARVPGWVDKATAPPEEGTAPTGRPDWEGPTLAVAEQLDQLANELQNRLALLDEEYDLLWWSHAARSLTADLPWSEVSPPARRVALVGHELGTRTRVPATLMVDGIGAVALGEVAAKLLAVADVVVALQKQGVAMAAVEHTLLPISTAVNQANIFTEDDTWKTVVEKIHGIDVSKKHPAAAIVRQIVRELHLGELL
jgi:GTPase-associated system helical domain